MSQTWKEGQKERVSHRDKGKLERKSVIYREFKLREDRDIRTEKLKKRGKLLALEGDLKWKLRRAEMKRE